MSSNYKNILLVGFRGAGKSTVGKILAKKLNWDFIDMDKQIEKITGKTPSQLSENGRNWKAFRQIEHKLLEDLLRTENAVIAAGGGIGVSDVLIDNEESETFGEVNAVSINDSKDTFAILLDTDIEKLLKRIIKAEKQSAQTVRPLLSKAGSNNGMNRLQALVKDSKNMYKKRQPLYAKLSKHTIDTGILSPKEASEKIIKILNNEQ